MALLLKYFIKNTEIFLKYFMKYFNINKYRIVCIAMDDRQALATVLCLASALLSYFN